MDKIGLKMSTAFFWIAMYFAVMLIYTFFNVAVWRKIIPKYSSLLNIIFIIASDIAFIILLCNKTDYRIGILKNVTIKNVFLAVGCAILFYLLLDKCLDPIFESLYPASEQSYQDTVQSLLKSPVTSLLQVCIIAPIVEEILMRGFILGGLRNSYGITIALLISAALFAVLHFNMVQTLSAFVCGIILGILFIKTGSISSCIIAHSGYNLISFAIMIMPYIK